jgi:membrane associated rhomboid family serine protease
LQSDSYLSRYINIRTHTKHCPAMALKAQILRSSNIFSGNNAKLSICSQLFSRRTPALQATVKLNSYLRRYGLHVSASLSNDFKDNFKLSVGSGDGIPNIDGALEEVKRLAVKYGGGGPSTPSPSIRKTRQQDPAGMGNGIFSLLILNFGIHIINYFWQPAWLSTLALAHWAPQWWQFVTAAFVHANWEHLLGNAFSLLVFGRMVEEEEGAFGVWMTYLICGIGGNLSSYLSSPATRTLSLGASSAVFGLFMVGVLAKLRPSAKRLLEAVILGSFVIKQVLQEVSMVSSGKAGLVSAGMSVGHWAHLGGAAAGVLLVLLLNKLPSSD